MYELIAGAIQGLSQLSVVLLASTAVLFTVSELSLREIGYVLIGVAAAFLNVLLWYA